MAEFLKSQSPQELWKASLKAKDPLKPEQVEHAADLTASVAPLQAAKPLGTGLVVDVTA